MDGVRSIYIANSREEALALADQGVIGYAWRTFWGHYGFYEAFRLAGQEGEIPWTLDSMERAHYLYVGTVDEIKRKLVEMVEACNPSYLVLLIDHSGSMRVGKRLGSLLRCAGFDRITMSASYQYVGTPEHRYLVSEMTARLCEEAAFMDEAMALGWVEPGARGRVSAAMRAEGEQADGFFAAACCEVVGWKSAPPID